MSNMNNIGGNITSNAKGFVNNTNGLFLGDEKVTASFLVLTGSIINYIITMKKKEQSFTQSMGYLLAIIAIAIAIASM